MRDFNNDLGRHYKYASDCDGRGAAASEDGDEDFEHIGTELFNQLKCKENDLGTWRQFERLEEVVFKLILCDSGILSESDCEHFYKEL